MATNYVVTAHKPSVVTASVRGHFTKDSDINLIVARANVIDIYVVAPEGLKPVKAFEVYGLVEHMKIFSLHQDYMKGVPHKQLLFVLTNRYHAMILEYDETSNSIITRAMGNMSDRTGRIPEYGPLVDIDPTCSVVGMRLYDGLFKIMELQPSYTSGVQDMIAFNLSNSSTVEYKEGIYDFRFEELTILDMSFLHGYKMPTIAILYSDTHGRHVKSYELNVRDKDFKAGPLYQTAVEVEAFRLQAVPSPFTGVLVIGHSSVSYMDERNVITVAPDFMKCTSTVALGIIDFDRYLLADLHGKIHLLYLEKIEDDKGKVKDIQIEVLGETSIPETITYLDNGFVYIGSRFGDSQLVKLSLSADLGPLNHIELIESHTNLGPIVDMVVVDIDKQGQGQLVTCSGAFKDGSIRFIRNGVGIEELASIEMDGITGMWPMRIECSETDNILVLSFVGETRMLKIMGEELEEADLNGFQMNEQTLHCANVVNNQILQMTVNAVRLIDQENGGITAEWRPEGNKRISVVSANRHQAVCASGKQLYYIEIEPNALVLKCNKEMEAEVSCLDVSPIFNSERMEFCSVGMWDVTIRLLKLDDLTEIRRDQLSGDQLARDVLMCRLGECMCLLCAMGDGSLIYYKLNSSTGELENRKKVTLGTKPCQLRLFRTSTDVSVFACSDRPTVVYKSNNDKLVFSNVNLKEVNYICPLNTTAYPDSIAITDGQTLSFGVIDEIKKLHTRSVPLGEKPSKISYQESTESFGILTMRVDIQGTNGIEITKPSVSTSTVNKSLATSKVLSSNNVQNSGDRTHNVGDEVEVHSLVIMDQQTLTVTHAHTFLANEFATSICSTSLGTDPDIFYVVGTTMIYPDEPEPTVGRLVIFSYHDGRLSQLSEKEVKGSPYKMCPMTMTDGTVKLVVCINNSVKVYEWTKEKELRQECTYNNNIVAIYLDVKGEFILVGDLMRSISLLSYKPAEGQLEELGRDHSPHWMTAAAIIDDDIFIGAENNHSIFTCTKDAANTNDEERRQLNETGMFHLGDFVNVFKLGSLVMHHDVADLSSPISKPLLYGTVHGAIGVVVQTTAESFEFLEQLQKSLCNVIKSVGGVPHSQWRSSVNENKKVISDMKGFIDGDLIEHFLDLEKELQQEVADSLKGEITGDELMKLVEDLSRIH